MTVSKGAKTHSSQKTVLPVDADRTMVILAHKLAPPYITETLPDCTLTPLGREPATMYHVHHRVPPHEQFVKQLQCPKNEDHHS